MRNYALEASAGMYYNFGDIKFRCDNANNGIYNQGWYTSITNGEKYDSNIEKTERQTATQLFVKQGISNGVRILTLPEINRALGRENLVAASPISDTEDPKGIYKLPQLKKVPKIDKIEYTSLWYWVASPANSYAWIWVMMSRTLW